MATVAEMLDRMSDWLDKARPEVKIMRVKVSRGVAMSAGARPEKRGGPLFYKGRQVIYQRSKDGARSWAETGY